MYRWPNLDAENEDEMFTPQILELRDHSVRFINISCGHDFVMGISASNLVYGQGVNKNGQLGLGDHKYREHFT